MGATIWFPQTDGGTAAGYLADAGAAKAGVVVIQEWWGLQGQIKSVCERLAAAGFHALAPDLFGGKVIPYHDPAGAKAAMGSLDFKTSVDQAVRGAVRYLKGRCLRVALIGFCMGGALTVIGAVRIPELDAAACFYGLPPKEVAAAKDVRVPIQGHFASIDDWCTPALVRDFEEELRAAGRVFEIRRYQAQHAFMNSDRKERYDGEAAKLAWDRCLAFLAKHMA